MPTGLQNIKNALVAAVAGVAGIQETGTLLKQWNEVSLFPSAFVWWGGDDKTRSPTRSKEVDASFGVLCYVKGDDPLDLFMDLYGKIEAAIEVDPTLGGLSLDAVVIGTSPLVTAAEIASKIHLGDVLVTVTYRHVRAVP